MALIVQLLASTEVLNFSTGSGHLKFQSLKLLTSVFYCLDIRFFWPAPNPVFFSPRFSKQLLFQINLASRLS